MRRSVLTLPTGLMAFEGDWALSRVIEDHRAGQVLRFAGTARFARDGDGLAYSESGKIALPDGGSLVAERRYRWKEQGDEIKVFFDTGAPFHRFSLASAIPDATHHCAPDDYAVRYDFTQWPNWQAVWRVTGPRKDYLMTSRYARSNSV